MLRTDGFTGSATDAGGRLAPSMSLRIPFILSFGSVQILIPFKYINGLECSVNSYGFRAALPYNNRMRCREPSDRIPELF